MRTNSKLITSLGLWATFFVLLSISTPSLQQLPFLPLPTITAPNKRLQAAFIGLQLWKKAVTSDPNHFTANWTGYDVCCYNGVYCAPAPDNPNIKTVAGIDLNHAYISGCLPEELGLYLTDLALLHLNSNRFSGTLPWSFSHLKLLHELDLSNNMFHGPFPSVLLSLPNLKFLDIRFNFFEGSIPPAIFDLKLDALFLNNNNFSSSIPNNIGNSQASVIVLANNNVNGCFPPGILQMGRSLEEIILMNSGLKGCLPESIGQLGQATVFDVSFNDLTGPLPESMGKMKSLQQLNVAHNKLTGDIPASMCSLPNLQNFTYSYNFFCSEPPKCLKLQDKDDKFNCIPYRPLQRSLMKCKSFLSHPPKCNSFGCPASLPPPVPSPPPPSPLPPEPEPEYTPPEHLIDIDIPPLIHIP